MPEPATALAQLLPAGAAAAEAFVGADTAALPDPGDGRVMSLFPEEQAVLRRAGAKRVREFVASRNCARAALAELGRPPAPIVPGPSGAPLWPAGVVGSLTHRAGYTVAVVAPADRLAGMGIDAEPDAPLPPGLLERIARPEERAWLAAQPARQPGVQPAGRPGVDLGRLLFSAKESVYKACAPLGGRRLGFWDATLTLDVERSLFVARLLLPSGTGTACGHRELTGRWTARAGLIVTLVPVPATPLARPDGRPGSGAQAACGRGSSRPRQCGAQFAVSRTPTGEDDRPGILSAGR